MDAATLSEVHAIAESIDVLTHQLEHYSGMDALSACITLRAAYAELSVVEGARPLPTGERDQPPPLADIAEGIRLLRLRMLGLPAACRLDPHVIAASSHLVLARGYIA